MCSFSILILPYLKYCDHTFMSPPTYADSRWPNSLNLQVAFYRGFVPGAFFFLRSGEDAQ